MLLEDAIKNHKRVADLLDFMAQPNASPAAHKDDIFVRPYIVRAHFRVRPVRHQKRLTIKRRLTLVSRSREPVRVRKG